jgi:DNA-binding NarL/FixJ family response regulator
MALVLFQHGRRLGAVADVGSVRILLAEGHSLFREAVRAVFESEPDLEVVAEASSGLEAVEESQRARPDIAFLDSALPNCDGIKAAALIKERIPDCKIMILSDTEDQGVLIEAIEAGASGYLTKQCPLADLIEAVRAVDRGETLIPPRMLGTLLARLIRHRREQERALRSASGLTRREREVLALLAEGADNQTIAQQLVISPQTARTHIQNIFGKLGVHSRLEAAAFVMQNQILDDLVESRS